MNDENKHKELTQKYSTWGDKLLQHTDVLYSIQHEQKFKPITIQLAPVEVCDSDCPFCSVANRPLKTRMQWENVVQVLTDFRTLGAKSLEITGGGNPMLYTSVDEAGIKRNINDVIEKANELGYKIGIITNSHKFKLLKQENFDKIDWIRVSLIKLDEKIEPEDYDFNSFPYSKLAFSYIVYDETERSPIRGRYYQGTTEETIEKIARLVQLHPDIKFVRFAGNCLIKGNNAEVNKKYRAVIDAVDKWSKFFIKDIWDDDGPFDDGCYIGMIRPYVAPSPHGDKYYVYTCTSHVLNTRTYDLDYALCETKDIIAAWASMNAKYKSDGHPYEVKKNCGNNWVDTCKFCYYKFNNKLLHTVANEMPDKDFP